MRIMLTVLDERGDRDVVVEGEPGTTVTRLAEALSRDTDEPLAKVVRLSRTRAPYGLEPHSVRSLSPAQQTGPKGHPHLWRDGRPLDPRAQARAVLRDGDRVTLDAELARATVIEEPQGVVEVRVVGGPRAGSVHRLGLGTHVIGSAAACAIAVPDPALPPEAAVVRVTPEAITVEPAPTRRPDVVRPPKRKHKGRYDDEVAELAERQAARNAEEVRNATLDGRTLGEAADWPEHALLACGSSLFTLAAIEPPDAHLAPQPDGGVAYNRPPRLRQPEPGRAFEAPVEPRRAETMRLQALAAFLPAVLGVTMVLVTGSWYFLLIAFMTPLIMVGQWWSDRRHGRKQHRLAAKEYKERLAAFEADVERARRQDELARRAATPDPAEVLLTATGPRRRLWERRIHDQDALRLRVGLADLPADLELKAGSEPLEPPLCRNVPVALPLRRLGVAGVTGARETATALTGWLVGQAAALHSPRDLAIVVISAHADGHQRWGWVRWLPHVTPRAGEECVVLVGSDPEGAARRVAELTALIDGRLNTSIPDLGKVPSGWDDLGGPDETGFTGYDARPYDVLVVLDGAQVLRGLPGMPQVLRQGPRAGVYTLAVDDDQRLLPEECETVATCDDKGGLRLRGGGLDALGVILADGVSPSWCERLARALAPLRDVSRDDPAAQLPDAVRLLDLLNLPQPTGELLAGHWTGHGSTEALIGVGPDGPYPVDLRLDGPHALVAGTTGAGKSELLQALICSLAVRNRPDELTFVLIDYKGGAAFKECVRLPHTVGMVSDLDGHLTQRALASLAAEIRRRERLLLDAGAKDIEDYQGTLPRLVLIIDEFAALVAELPDFVAGLVDIARRGRSLGIHLILATQRPAGVVTADIQANTSLRIALRVTEAGESADVIDLPDAAHISKATPGRCYVKSGAGAAVAVQTAWVGGRAAGGAPGQVRVVEVGWPELGRPLPAAPEPEGAAAVTDLTVLADALVEAARLAGVPEQASPWLPPLPARVVAPESGDSLEYGVTDLPWAQDRRPLALDLERGGHLLIAGASRSGRSTALRTIAGAIAAGASPADVHLHAIDCGSGALLPLVALPHCGAVVTRDQLDRVERLLTRLRQEVGRRQQLLAEAGHASLAEYRQAGHALPWLVLMLDRWEGYVAAFEGYDYGRLTEALLQLLREGPAVGLRAIVTGDRSALIGQVSTVFDERLILRLADPSDYGLAGLSLKDLPSSMPPGRAVSAGEHGLVESQIALLDADPSGPAQVAALQARARRRRPEGEPPMRVDALPTRITAGQALDLVPGFSAPSPLWALLGAGGDSLEPLGVDLLAQGPGAVIAGPARSGRSSALLTAARSLLAAGTPVVAVVPRRSPLRELEGALAVLDGNGAGLRELLDEHERYVVIVDDAELINPDAPLGLLLDEVLKSGRDGEHGLIIAGATGDLATSYRGFVAETRKARTGLLLSVQSPADGDLFTVRLPRGAVGGPPGRGLLVTLGTVTPIQTALPDFTRQNGIKNTS
ncbi:FtsK/SpoIIIE domain-containing protein [Nonomuraea sp. NPDC046570]|uniref:FtsK/SpoIIIE domain-containing protein n=1 Tax=Nonomuraea sp. NPDC046570 TaxID=3155255 RepID=UPI00340E91EB